jgi:hypothetical protein
MPPRQRLTVFIVVGLLWLTGCAWLALDQFFAKRGPFGATPHPLQPGLLLAHGILAIIGVYVLGWVSSRHILPWWSAHDRRLSGGAFAALLAVLVVSGFALFFVSDDQWQRGSAWVHDVVGLVVTLFALQHWLFARRREAPRLPWWAKQKRRRGPRGARAREYAREERQPPYSL